MVRRNMKLFVISVLLAGANCGLMATEAKLALRAALETHKGSTKAPPVVAAIKALSALSPYKAPAREPALLGAWQQINSPDFPSSKQTAEGDFQYTLGKLSFGVFEPKNLMCTLGKVCNPLSEGTESMVMLIDYEIQVQLNIETEDGLPMPAELITFAKCARVSDDRVSVAFAGGVLKPVGNCDREAWRRTFAPSLAAKPRKRTLLMNWLLQRMMGLVKPNEMTEDGAMRYEMTKAPEGYLDILYLDDDLRITRGNRGSYVVAKRVTE